MGRKKDEKFIERLIASFAAHTNNGIEPNALGVGWLRTFVDKMPGGFFVYSARDGKILFTNKALLDIFKCNDREEFMQLTGGTFRGMVYPDDYQAVDESIADQITHNSNNLDYVEYRIVRRDGEVRWIEDFGHFVRNDEVGDIYYVFVIDATEKITRRIDLINSEHQKEQELQSLIEEYDKERKIIRRDDLQRLEVIEGLSVNYDSILYADIDEDIVLPYRLSKRLERQFEKKLQAKPFRWMLRDYISVWVHPDDRRLVAERTSPEYMREHLSEASTYYLNYRCIQNGKTQYIQLRIVNVGDPKRANRVVMGYRNVDDEMLQEMEQKKLFRDALNAARLADATKSTFLSNMSHDMRTPLNAIFGFTKLARKNTDKPDALNNCLDKIELAGKQMLDLVEKILQMSYNESQNIPVIEDECTISDIMQDVYATVAERADSKQISLSLGQSVRHNTVIADGEKLKQLMGHLAGNAVKFTRPGGKVTLSVSEQENPKGKFSTFRFVIEDTGIGISPEAIERIFDPFEREINTTLSGEYGTGLGLTIAKRIADMLGGHIDVKSTPNIGSTFTVTIGLRLPKCEEDRVGAGEPCRGKLLLVDDNEFNLEIETEILEDLGFTVECAANGLIAVDKIKSSAPGEYSFILMDIQMPVMDGRAATREIRSLENRELAEIPIVALSANAFETDKRASLECGMDEHLAKPLDVDVLMCTLSRVLGDRSSRHADNA